MVVEIWIVKAILRRPQVEMRKILLDNGEKVIHVTNWQRTWPNCVCFTLFL